MVIWTPRARADLKAIHDHVAKDSRANAQRVAREILRKADTLTEPPHPGRKVPELNDPYLREVARRRHQPLTGKADEVEVGRKPACIPVSATQLTKIWVRLPSSGLIARR